MKKHYVTFMSPGTFIAEQQSQEIESWDVDEAIRRAQEIKERYNAKPYGFCFSTKERSPDEWEPKQTHKSGTYYLDGVIRTVDEVRAAAREDEKILLWNMEANGWDRIVTTCSPWRWTQPFEKNDFLITAEDIKRATRKKKPVAV